MRDQAIATAVQVTTAGVAAAGFATVPPLGWAAAIVGAAAARHLEDKPAEGVVKLALGIVVMAVIGVAIALAVPHTPDIGPVLLEIPVDVRSFFGGLLSGVIYKAAVHVVRKRMGADPA